MLIDTHSHLNFRAFDDDRQEVIKRTLDNDIWLINASSNFFTSQKAVEIAEQYQEGVYASIGLHPINIKQTALNQDNRLEDALEDFFDYEKYKGLAGSPKVVAIGEIGLDYADFVLKRSERQQNRAPAVAEGGLGMFTEKVKEKQTEVFLKQLELAKDLNLPVIFHCRKAHNDLIETMCNFCATAQKLHINGVLHCFVGNWAQAQEYLQMGLYLGFNGIIFKLNLDEIIKKTPLDRILVETDCPFLTPPALDAQRNEPLNVKYVIQKIAQLRGEPFKKISEFTTQNSVKLFNLT